MYNNNSIPMTPSLTASSVLLACCFINASTPYLEEINVNTSPSLIKQVKTTIPTYSSIQHDDKSDVSISKMLIGLLSNISENSTMLSHDDNQVLMDNLFDLM